MRPFLLVAAVLVLSVAVVPCSRAQTCEPPANADAVRSCTTYSYNDAQLPVEITRIGSDGSYQRETILYLSSDWGNHPWVSERGQMAPVWKTTTWDGPPGTGEAVACTRTVWEEVDGNAYDEPPPGGRPPNWAADPYLITYRPKEMYEGCGEDEVLVLSFEEYDTAQRVLETRAGTGLVTEYFYGTTADPMSNSTNNPYLTGTRQK